MNLTSRLAQRCNKDSQSYYCCTTGPCNTLCLYWSLLLCLSGGSLEGLISLVFLSLVTAVRAVERQGISLLQSSSNQKVFMGLCWKSKQREGRSYSDYQLQQTLLDLRCPAQLYHAVCSAGNLLSQRCSQRVLAAKSFMGNNCCTSVGITAVLV